jgi:hypothetical protein
MTGLRRRRSGQTGRRLPTMSTAASRLEAAGRTGNQVAGARMHAIAAHDGIGLLRASGAPFLGGGDPLRPGSRIRLGLALG